MDTAALPETATSPLHSRAQEPPMLSQSMETYLSTLVLLPSEKLGVPLRERFPSTVTRSEYTELPLSNREPYIVLPEKTPLFADRSPL